MKYEASKTGSKGFNYELKGKKGLQKMAAGKCRT